VAVFEAVITYTWTILSVLAVLLALWATSYAKREARQTREERAYQRSRRVTNGRLVIAEQQCSQAIKLLWAHRGVYVHQGLFLITGLYALCLLSAQFVIVGMQVLLFLVSREQRQAREDWESREQDTTHLQESVDAGIEIARDTNERVTEMQERGQSDQPLEQKDRAEGELHRHPQDE
jgi:uncharacterized membrane protein